MSEYLEARPSWASAEPPAAADAAGDVVDAGDGGGWDSGEVVLAGAAVLAILVVAYLVYADGASGGEEATDEEEDGQDSDGAHDAHSAESEPWQTGGETDTFATVESGGGLVQR